MTKFDPKKFAKRNRQERLEAYNKQLESMLIKYERVLWLVGLQENGNGRFTCPAAAREVLEQVRQSI